MTGNVLARSGDEDVAALQRADRILIAQAMVDRNLWPLPEILAAVGLPADFTLPVVHE